MNIKEVLDRTTNFFKEKKFESPRLDAEILIAKALNLRRIDLYIQFDNPMNEAEIDRCRNFVRRRGQGEPVAYIVGEREFFGNSFYVNQSVLIPRPETEILVESVVNWIAGRSHQDSAVDMNILDLGSGSGCIGLSILKKFPGARLTLVDISADALEVSKRNADKLGLLPQCEFINENVENLRLAKQFDIIVANPPYIDHEDKLIAADVRKYEPHVALFASENGEYHIRRWSQLFSENLSRNSLMAFEVGHQQARAIEKLFQQFNIFQKVEIVRDFSGYDRHIIGYKTLES